MEQQHLLFESIFDAPTADTVEKLESITKKYPYFSIAQFYLLQLMPAGSGQRRLQAKKTSALFNNNYWLNFQLKAFHTSIENNVASVDAGSLSSAIAHISPALSNQDLEAIAGDVKHLSESEFPVIDDQPAPNNTDESPAEEEITERAALSPEQIPAESGSSVMNEEPLLAGTEPTVDFEPGIVSPEVATATGDTNDGLTPAEPLPAAPEAVNAVAPIADDVQVSTNTTLPEKAKPQENAQEEIPLPAMHFDFNASATAADNSLLFEPLHTTDYFASVGIKISDEVKPNDKLGKQLKSFTEWLKTMKKIHADPALVSGNDATAESNIKQLAEQSNQDDTVLTEAMAEVLMQQGRNKKAIEVLEKLSLLNPGKSAYFAAKINQIKEQ